MLGKSTRRRRETERRNDRNLIYLLIGLIIVLSPIHIINIIITGAEFDLQVFIFGLWLGLMVGVIVSVNVMGGD
jgi:uncharacterized membrane protein YdjX (TVP38/TMEM64 family)